MNQINRNEIQLDDKNLKPLLCRYSNFREYITDCFLFEKDEKLIDFIFSLHEDKGEIQ